MTFPILLAAIGLLGAYSLYALAAVLSVFFVVRHVHETPRPGTGGNAGLTCDAVRHLGRRGRRAS